MSSAVQMLSPLKMSRREKILDAAESLFRGLGFRATTMTSVAEQVGMSKVTVYSYFSDKDALFEAVASRIADSLRVAVLSALKEISDPREAVTTALTRKHLMVFDLVRSSDFSMELFAAKSLFAASQFKQLDQDIEKALGNKLSDKSLARILFGASIGIANKSMDKEQLQKDLGRLIDKMVP